MDNFPNNLWVRKSESIHHLWFSRIYNYRGCLKRLEKPIRDWLTSRGYQDTGKQRLFLARCGTIRPNDLQGWKNPRTKCPDMWHLIWRLTVFAMKNLMVLALGYRKGMLLPCMLLHLHSYDCHVGKTWHFFSHAFRFNWSLLVYGFIS